MYKVSSFLYRLLLPFLSLSRASKILLAVWIDGLLFLAAWLGAYLITYSHLDILQQSAAVLLFGGGLIVSLSVMFRFGLNIDSFVSNYGQSLYGVFFLFCS